LRWQGSAIGKNAIINGACEIAQRGTAAVTLTAAAFNYPVDRFIAARTAGTSGATAQQITSTGLDGFRNAIRIQRTAGDTATNELQIGQTFETANSIPFAGKSVVLSFWARAGANYSPTSSALSIRLYTGTGTDQGGYGYNFTGTSAPINSTATLTTSWQRFQYTATLASTATQMQFLAFCNPTGTAGAADSFDITGVQVELGSIATPFSRSQGTIQGELDACSRYYFRNSAATSVFTFFANGWNFSTTQVMGVYTFPVTMRVSPTLETSGTAANYRTFSTAGSVTCSAVPLQDTTNPNTMSIQFIVASGLTAGQGASVLANNSSAAFLGFSAEL
jgi:hypothetical protein